MTKFTTTELNKNKYKIAFSVLKNHGFSTDEINSMYNLYKKSEEKWFARWLMKKERSDRENECGRIFNAINNLYGINDLLDCNPRYSSFKNASLSYVLGIFKSNGMQHQRNRKIWLADDNNIIQYFNGYKNKKELWDYLRDHPIDEKTFFKIIVGEYSNFLKDRQNQKSIEDLWN